MLEDIKPHLAELRMRIFISIMALIVAFVLSFIFYKPILDWVTAPLESALHQVNKKVQKSKEGKWSVANEGEEFNVTLQSDTNRSTPLFERALQSAQKVLESNSSTQNERLLASAISDLALNAKRSQQLKNSAGGNVLWGSVTTNQIGGVFMVALKVSLYSAIFLALPIILWQMWLFIAPGLYENEKKMALPFLIGVTVMFAVGVLFAYYIVTPFGFQFLITFGAFLYTPLINIEDYIGFFAKILFGFGLAFELPMIVYFLASIKLITEKTLLDFFKYAVVAIFIIAALLTPPDVITQLLMAAPLILLYGVSILVAKVINPYKDEDDEEEEESTQKKEEQKLLNNDDR